jgi:hypothetical protein
MLDARRAEVYAGDSEYATICFAADPVPAPLRARRPMEREEIFLSRNRRLK